MTTCHLTEAGRKCSQVVEKGQDQAAEEAALKWKCGLALLYELLTALRYYDRIMSSLCFRYTRRSGNDEPEVHKRGLPM